MDENIQMTYNEILGGAEKDMLFDLNHTMEQSFLNDDFFHVCRCPTLTLKDGRQIRSHQDRCVRYDKGQRIEKQIWSHKTGDKQIAVAYHHGTHSHPAIVQTISSFALLVMTQDTESRVVQKLIERAAVECPNCPRPAVRPGNIACNLHPREMSDLMRHGRFFGTVMVDQRGPGRSTACSIDTNILALVTEALGLSKTEVWWFQDRIEEGVELKLDLKVRYDMRERGWPRFPDGLPEVHYQDYRKTKEVHPAHVFGILTPEAIEMASQRVYENFGAPEQLLVPASTAEAVKRVLASVAKIIAGDKQISAIVGPPPAPVTITHHGKVEGFEIIRTPASLPIGTYCMKCKNTVKERMLLNETFVGCLC